MFLPTAGLEPEATVVGIDFRKFLRVTHIKSLLVVPLNFEEINPSKNGFLSVLEA